MDGLPLSNKDPTDRSRRRISSILKAPRSPLKDLGCGNELYQDSTLDKRRKSSRRVSFAETISVFTPELQCAGEAAANSNDHETGRNNPKNENQESNTDYNITGMETLLHAPIQTTILQSEWECGGCLKDKTIVFSNNNDMDMTTSNTVTIDGYPEIKAPKIDTSLFIASLKSQTEDFSENTDFQFSKSVQTKSGFQPTEYSVPTKRKFEDFLSSLKIGKGTAPHFDEVDKENVFPPGLQSRSSRHLFFEYGNKMASTQDTTGNVTHIFRERDDGLDLTKCHTTSITSFIPLGINEYSSNGLTTKPLHVLKDESKVLEDDMDMTYSHTVHIDAVPQNSTLGNGQSLKTRRSNGSNSVPSEKTIVFTEPNEMEFTENHTFALNTMMPQKQEALFLEHTSASPVEDMDFTKSHTVAINGQSIFNEYATTEFKEMSKNQDMDLTHSDTADLYIESNIGDEGDKVNVLSKPFIQTKSLIMKTETKQTEAGKFYGAAFSCDNNAMGLTESYRVSTDSKGSQDIPNIFKRCKTDENKYGGLQLSSVVNKSTLFLTDNDLHPTKCHLPERPSKEKENNPKSNCLSEIHRKRDKKRASVNVLSFSCVHDQTELLQDDMEMTINDIGNFRRETGTPVTKNAVTTPCTKDKTILFSRDQQEMDITQSHTVVIDSKCLNDGAQGNVKSRSGFHSATKQNTFSGFLNDLELQKSCTNFVDANNCGSGLPNSDVQQDLCDGKTIVALEDEMEFTKSYTVSIESKADKESDNGIMIPLIKRKSMSEKALPPVTLCMGSQERAILFPSNKNVNLMKQSTAEANFGCVGLDNKNIDQASKVDMIVSDKTLVQEVEMELTESHKILPTTNSAKRHSQHSLGSGSLTCTPNIQEDMDITNSNTVCIDNVLVDEIPVAAVKRKSITYLQRTPHEKTIRFLSDMEITCTDAGRLFEAQMRSEKKGNAIARPSQDESLMFSYEPKDMDITRSCTVAIENNLFDRNKNPNPILKAGQKQCFATMSASANKTVILKDDMEFTKSHTGLINRNNLHPLSERSAFSVQDEMEITKSNTVFIDNIPADKSKVDLSPHNGCHEQTVHLFDDMEMTMPANTGLLTGKMQPKTEDERAIKSVKSQDKTFVFSSERSQKDITKSHSVCAEKPFLDDLTKTCNLERKGKLSSSNLHLTCNMDITKSNTVFIDNLFVSETPHRTVALDNKLGSDMEVSSTAGHLISQLQNQQDGARTAISKVSQDKTMVFSDEMNDMDITRSQTIVIENKAFEVKKTHSANNNALRNDPEACSIPVKETISPVKDDIEYAKSQTWLNDTSQALQDASPASKGVCEQEDVEMTDTVFFNNTLTNVESKTSLHSLPFIKKKSIVIAKPHSDMENTEFGELAIRKNTELKGILINDQVVTSAPASDMKDCCAMGIEGDCLHGKSHLPFQTKGNDTSLPICSIPNANITGFSALHSCNVEAFTTEFAYCTDSNITENIAVKGRPGVLNEKYDGSSHEQKEMENGNPSLLAAKKIVPDKQIMQSLDLRPLNGKSDEIISSNLAIEISSAVTEEDALPTSILKGGSLSCTNVMKPTLSLNCMESLTNNATKKDTLPDPNATESLLETNINHVSTPYFTNLNRVNDGDQVVKVTMQRDNETLSLVAKDPEHVLSEEHVNCSDEKNHDYGISPNWLEKSDALRTPGKECRQLEDVDITENCIASAKRTYGNDMVENCSKMIQPVMTGNCTAYQDSDEKDCMPFDVQNDCMNLKEDKSSVTNTNIFSFKDDQSDNKARRKSKRVSFMLPEKADSCVYKTEAIEESNAVMKDISHISSNSEVFERATVPVSVVAEQSHTQTSTSSISTSTGHPSNGSPTQLKNLILEDRGGLPELVFSHSVTNVGATERISPSAVPAGISDFPKNDKCRRRSIADIHLKIKNLAQKSKMVPSCHTAPVSCFLDQLPTPEQTSDARLCTEEQHDLDTETTTNKEPSLKNEEELIEVDSFSTARHRANPTEMCLPNMLSVKIFQPKLPQKRSSSIHNMPELHPSVSEVPLRVNRPSQGIFKALTENAQNIDEEMLPACPGDLDPNGLFHFEVPEGAWEELCEKEALHEDLGHSSSKPPETKTAQKRTRDTEDDGPFNKEKRARQNKGTDMHSTVMLMDSKSTEEYHTSEHSTLHATNYSGNSSSMDSRGEGLSVELGSQHCSQMDSQLPWEPECLWQKFQEGTITVKEFFTLLRIRILIQKPRSSVLPASLGGNEEQSALDVMLDQCIYQPKLQVYEEHFNMLYQTAEELKICIEMQEKPFAEVNSLLWEAMRMCSEDEVIYFGVKLKCLKTLYAKRNKLIAHQGKVTVYSRLLQSLQEQWEQLQSRMSETDKLLQEADNCISELDMETDRLETECRHGNALHKDQRIKVLENEIEDLKLQEEDGARKCAQLEERKQQVFTEVCRLQEEAQTLNEYLQNNNFTEWRLDSWAEDQAVFCFLYDSLELTVLFGDFIDGVNFINTPCRQISSIRFESLLNDTAPSSSLMVHGLILRSIEKKGHLHEHYKTSQELSQLLFDVSLIVNRCRLLGEEVQYLVKWGAKFNLLKTEVNNTQVKLLFSSVAACAKFELMVHLSELYPVVPLSFTVQNLIGKIDHDKITAVLSKVPVGFEYLKRAVCQIYTRLLV